MSILKIENLNLYYANTRVLKNINISLEENTILGIAGESGSGKSSLINSIMRLVPVNTSKLDGKIRYKGKDILKLDTEQLYKLRGKEIGLIAQAHSSSLNPVLKVGSQIEEAISVHNPKKTKEEIKKIAKDLLSDLDFPLESFNAYPHQLSGGLKQRVIIAIAIANKPRILLADEPTTALDPRIERGVIKLLYKIKQKYQQSIIFVSHDIDLLATISDQLAIMHNGEIIEWDTAETIYNAPQREYTKNLINSTRNI